MGHFGNTTRSDLFSAERSEGAANAKLNRGAVTIGCEALEFV
jgi:hypothetical protein